MHASKIPRRPRQFHCSAAPSSASQPPPDSLSLSSILEEVLQVPETGSPYQDSDSDPAYSNAGSEGEPQLRDRAPSHGSSTFEARQGKPTVAQHGGTLAAVAAVTPPGGSYAGSTRTATGRNSATGTAEASTTFSAVPASTASAFSISNSQPPQTPPLPPDVTAFLSSRGVSEATMEAMASSLPHSLEVLKERMEFLTLLGLDAAQVVNSFPPLLGCSVSRNFIPVLAFLESISISESDLPTLVAAYPNVLYASVVNDLTPRIDFILGLGVEKADVPRVLLGYPQVLGLPLEGTMSTAVAYLVGIGVSMRSIGPIIAQHPPLLGCSVRNNLLLKVHFLQSLGIRTRQIASLVEVNPFLLVLDLETQIKAATSALVAAGVPETRLGQVLLAFPQLTTLNVAAEWSSRAHWLTQTANLRPSDLASVLTNMPQLLVMNIQRGGEKLDFLRRWGFDSSQVAEVVSRCPQLLGLHIGRSLGPKLSFLDTVCDSVISDVVEYPQCLLVPLDEIEDRMRKVRSARVSKSLGWVFNCSPEDFQVRLQAEISFRKTSRRTTK